MPDSDPSSSNATAELTTETRNLPALVPSAPADVAREGGDSVFSRWFRALFGWRAGTVRADLKVVLEESTQTETGFSPEEVTMLKNILGLRERRISDVMVPRADIVAVQQEIPIGELVKVFEGAGHSRLVVFNDTLDDPVGMVHIRDLIAYMTARAMVGSETKTRRRKSASGLDLKAIDLSMPLSAAKIIRTILFVPPSMPAIDLLAKMQATRIHLALVVDEYGGTDGIASIEDIVEQIVGEIEDEHDDDEAPSVVQQTDGSFIADARASLEDVIAIIGNGFNVGEAAKEVDTLGGYLVTQVGRVPVRGELVPGPGTFEFEVLDADPRRVKKVKIHSGKIPRASRARESRSAAMAAAQKRGADDARTPDADAASDSPSRGAQQQ
jgi:CBS domain containing-hemolysin-like protein